MSGCGVGLREPRGAGLSVVAGSPDVAERLSRLSRLGRRRMKMGGRRVNFKTDLYMYYCCFYLLGYGYC